MSPTTTVDKTSIDNPMMPDELRVAIRAFWPESEWDNAASISALESHWDAFVVNNTVDEQHPCNSRIGERDGVVIYAERSIGYFQINSCSFLDWEWQRLYNARHNAGTAHLLWDEAGQSWSPWYFSAVALGLIEG